MLGRVVPVDIWRKQGWYRHLLRIRYWRPVHLLLCRHPIRNTQPRKQSRHIAPSPSRLQKRNPHFPATRNRNPHQPTFLPIKPLQNPNHPFLKVPPSPYLPCRGWYRQDAGTLWARGQRAEGFPVAVVGLGLRDEDEIWWAREGRKG